MKPTGNPIQIPGLKQQKLAAIQGNPPADFISRLVYTKSAAWKCLSCTSWVGADGLMPGGLRPRCFRASRARSLDQPGRLIPSWLRPGWLNPGRRTGGFGFGQLFHHLGGFADIQASPAGNIGFAYPPDLGLFFLGL
jgi:hypothetical protein